MSVSSLNNGPIASGLAGIQSASALLDGAASEIASATMGQSSDLEGAAVDMIRSEHAMAASVAVVEAADSQLETLVDLFT